jgi:hypothetical protein
VCFHGSACHIQLARDFGIVTALQKQFDNLLFARAEPNGLFPHHFPLFLASPPPRNPERRTVSGFHSIHNATLRQIWL